MRSYATAAPFEASAPRGVARHGQDHRSWDVEDAHAGDQGEGDATCDEFVTAGCFCQDSKGMIGICFQRPNSAFLFQIWGGNMSYPLRWVRSDQQTCRISHDKISLTKTWLIICHATLRYKVDVVRPGFMRLYFWINQLTTCLPSLILNLGHWTNTIRKLSAVAVIQPRFLIPLLSFGVRIGYHQIHLQTIYN